MTINTIKTCVTKNGVEFKGVECSDIKVALERAANIGGEVIKLERKIFVVNAEEADMLTELGVSFAYICIVDGRPTTIPVN